MSSSSYELSISSNSSSFRVHNNRLTGSRTRMANNIKVSLKIYLWRFLCDEGERSARETWASPNHENDDVIIHGERDCRFAIRFINSAADFTRYFSKAIWAIARRRSPWWQSHHEGEPVSSDLRRCEQNSPYCVGLLTAWVRP